MSHTDSDRRSLLLSLKLRALVREHLGLDDDPAGQVAPFALGAALRTNDALWILIDGDAQRSLGPALAWAGESAGPIHLLVERDSGVLARRAQLLNKDLAVWHVDDRSLLPAVVEPYPVSVPVDPRHGRFEELIRSAGAEPVIEHGIVTGEVRGLEMCRVVDDPFSGEVRLEVGMGRHDREAFSMVHGDLPTQDALRQVIDAVLPHRSEGADPHPFNQFGAERLLRWRSMQQPTLVGFRTLMPAQPPVPRTNVKDAVPCVALGTDETGHQTTVVFVHGVDLDVVPYALDAAAYAASSRVVIAARDKDIVPAIRSMAGRGMIPTTFVSVD